MRVGSKALGGNWNKQHWLCERGLGLDRGVAKRTIGRGFEGLYLSIGSGVEVMV